MNVIPISLYTAAFTLCAFSAGLLNRRESSTGRASAYFCAFLTVESFSFAFEFLMHDPAAPLKAIWLGLRMSTSLLIAPCLWLAVREIAEGVRPRFSSLSWKHLAPIAAGTLLTFPLLQTAHFGLDYRDPHHTVSRMHSIFIHGTMLLCITIFSVQAPFYLRRCRRILEEHDRNEPLRWLYFPMAIAACTWVLGIVRTLQCILVATREVHVVIFALIEVGVTVWAIYAIVKQAGSPEAAQVESKYARSSLDAHTRERILRKLETAMVTDELYRDSRLNLRSLSAALRENPHYVSQVINQDLSSGFYQLVNGYRIEQAKKHLLDSPGRAVLDIALSVGFSSKSTFNTAFRRYTATTPREYRSLRPA